MRLAITALILSAIFAATAAQGVPTFDFKSARLGMTISEFKQDANWKKDRCKTSSRYKGMGPETRCERIGMFNLDPFAGTTVVGLVFLQALDGIERLSSIAIVTHLSNALVTENALAQKFGSAPVRSVGTATNAFGAEYETTTAVWKNDDSTQTVLLSAPCYKIDQMCLTYENIPLVSARIEELKKAMKSQADRF